MLHNAGDPARYDGFAEWYDAYLQEPQYQDVQRHMCGLVGSGVGVHVDAGFGIGEHLNALTSQGWTAVGVDISGDPIHLAGQRWHAVVQADVARMPFPLGSVSRVVSVLTLTDFDDVYPFFMRAKRILVPGGRLVVTTAHLCFVGPFARREPSTEGVVTIHPGGGLHSEGSKALESLKDSVQKSASGTYQGPRYLTS